MADELGVFIPYVGGVEYANVLLPPLETLCTVEETCVRDKSVESLCRIGTQMIEQDLVDHFIPLVKVWILLIILFVFLLIRIDGM
jgi:serine/threonine-protein phosphatase 2A regulatory subunit A